MSEPKRMTDEEFHSELDGYDKAGRYTRAMVFAAREADRARASEAEKDKKLQEQREALKAALVLLEGYEEHARAVGGIALSPEGLRILQAAIGLIRKAALP